MRTSFRSLRRLLRTLSASTNRGLAGKLFAMLALSLASGAATGLLPGAIGLAISAVLGTPVHASGPLAWARPLLVGAHWVHITWMAAILSLGGVWLSVLAARKSAELSAEATFGLRQVMLARILSSPTRAWKETAELLEELGQVGRPPGVSAARPKAPPPAEIMKLAVIRDAPQAAELAMATVSGGVQASMAALLLTAELSRAWLAFVGTVALFILSRAFAHRASRKVSQALASQQQVDSRVFSGTSEFISAAEELRILGATEQVLHEFDATGREWQRARAELSARMAVSSQSRSALGSLAPLLVVVALKLSTSLTVGEIATLVLVVPMLLARLEALDAVRTGLVERGFVLSSVEAVLRLESFPPQGFTTGLTESSPMAACPVGQITFSDISFRPVGAEKAVLEALSMEIPAGALVGITGRSGSGKSTIARLLGRLDSADSGDILLDEQLHVQITEKRFRDWVAVAGQSSKLLERSLRENLRLGAQVEHDDAALFEVLKCLELDEFATPLGLDTRFVASPPRFSGGEQRRMVLARALLRKSPVLVLDEPESALPTGSAARILKRIAERRRNLTTLVITQNPALVPSDFNVLLDQGRIVAQGSHTELLETSTLYRDLVADAPKGA